MSELFYYTARDLQGGFVRGSLKAGDRSDAVASLRGRSLYITSLETAGGARGAISGALHFGRVSRASLAAFFRSLAVLTSAGVPLRKSFEVTIAQCTQRQLREALSSVACDIENGLPLSEAMSRHPQEFPAAFVVMIKAGEVGGVLEDVLERLASLLERERAAGKRLMAALAYPAIVGCSAIGLIIFLLTSIVPAFEAMYEQLHVPLPAVTVVLIHAGAVMRSPSAWGATAIAAVLTVFAWRRLRTTPEGALAVERILYALPVAGTVARKSALAQIARVLGTLLRSGVAVAAALDVLMDIVTSARYRESLSTLRQALDEGELFSHPLARCGLYDPMFVQMVRVGEETGALDVMLLRIGDYYDLDVETMLSALGSMLEPIMILLLGGTVGFIVAAIFIPLYTLIGNIK